MPSHPLAPLPENGQQERFDVDVFFDLSPDGLCLIGTDGYVRHQNPALERTLGYSAEAFRARPFLEFVHPDERPAIQAVLEVLAARETTMPFEARCRHTDGTYRHLHWKARSTPERGLIYAVARDVTEQRRALDEQLRKVEATLRESEARARAILETTVDGIVTIDEEGRIESFNAAAETIFGYTAAEVLGRNVTMLMPAPYRDEHDHYLRRYLETGARKIIGIGREVQGRHKDGSVFPINLAVSEVRLGDRRLFTGIVRDISERKQTEETLRVTGDQQRTLVNALSEGVVMQDATGSIVACNNSAEHILGLTTDQMMGRTPMDPRWQTIRTDGSPFPSDEYPSITTLRTGAPLRDQVMGVRKPSGEQTWLSINTAPLFLEQAEAPYAVVSSFANITERRQAEETARDRVARMRLLYEITSQTGLTIGDQVRHALERVTQVLGMEIGLLSRIEGTTYTIEACHAPGTDLAPGHAFDLGETYCSLTLDAEDVFAIDHMQRSPHRRHPCYQVFSLESYIGVPVLVNGAVYGTLNFSSTRPRTLPFSDADVDTTRLLSLWVSSMLERKQAIEAIRQKADALQKSNEELEQFAYVASHDLQEPLRTISSFVQLLQQRYQGQLDEDADEFITFIVDAAERMQALIRDLLAYSRVGTREISPRPVDASEVLQQILAGMRTTLEAAQAEITFDTLPRVHADATQLGLLLQNLISNGIKFRGEAAPRIHVSAEQLDDSWRFAVRDNGIGVKDVYQDRIFEVFRRLHSWNQYAGTGIGLAICKKIVERHGGRIGVASKPGQGATFFFTLPFHHTQPMQHPHTP